MKIEYLFVKKNDDFCNTEEQFKSMLLSNSRISFQDNFLSIGKYKLEYVIKQDAVDAINEILFFLSIEGVNDEDEEQQLKALEEADHLIRRIVEQYKIFYINTIWDDISIYYGEKLYPKIVHIENLLRKIIYIFMIKNLGSEWVEQAIPREVKDSINKTKEKNGDKLHNLLTDCLYSADFIQLGNFFFLKYARQQDCQKMLRSLKSFDEYTKEKIDELIEPYESKSNWDRYFSEAINVNKLEEKWEELYGYRNQVAHSKKIDNKDYTRAVKLIGELESSFDKCLEHVNCIQLTETERNAVQAVAEKTIEHTLVTEVANAAYNVNMNCDLISRDSILSDISPIVYRNDDDIVLHANSSYINKYNLSSEKLFVHKDNELNMPYNALIKADTSLVNPECNIRINTDSMVATSMLNKAATTFDSIITAKNPLTEIENLNLQIGAFKPFPPF